MRAVRANHQIGLEHIAVGKTYARTVGGKVQHLRARVDPGEIRLETQRGIQRTLDDRRLDDPRQLRHGRLKRGKMEFGVGVAVGTHVVERARDFDKSSACQTRSRSSSACGSTDDSA